MIFPFRHEGSKVTAREGQGARSKIAVCIRVRLRESDYLSDTRYELEDGFSREGGTETDKIKGITKG